MYARLTSSSFDCQKIQIRTLDGHEAISRPFRFVLEVVCLEPAELIPTEVVGADATLVLEQEGLEIRSIHGMIAQIDDLLDVERDFRSYRLELVPHAYRLSMVETQEVFLDLSVPDIVKSKLEMVGLGADVVDFRLTGAYPQRELVVEYKETDLDFVSRLTEHLGVSYFFQHDERADKIVFADNTSAFPAIVGDDKVLFRTRGEEHDVYRLELRSRMMPAVYVMQDYNYRTPRVDLTSSYESASGNAGGVVEYGGHHKTPTEGMALAEARAQEREARFNYYEGDSDVCRFTAGATFELSGHPRLPDARLLLVEVEHHLTQTVMTEASGKEKPYKVHFRAVDASRTYRPPRITPKPHIHGVLTATVEHELGEAPGMGKIARIDEQGRYLVRFHFDTGSAKRKRSSHPLRMVQPHAGPNYGIHFPLKPDAEVTVTFIDGDPDRPLISGAVPNPVAASPVSRANAMMHTIQTASGISIEMRDTP